MRIAYVCTDPDVAVFRNKGSSIHVREVIRSFVRLGARVDLFAARLDGEVPPELATIRRHRLPSLPRGDLAENERAAQSANSALWSALWREGPFDLIYERYSLWSFAGMMYARIPQIPSILEVNAPLVKEQARHGAPVHGGRAEEIATRVFALADAIVAVSEEVAQYVEGCPGASPSIHVIPNGVRPERFPANVSPTLPAAPGVFTIGFLGSLDPGQGLDVLAQSFAVLQRAEGGVRLLVVGDGPEQYHMRMRLEEEGVGEAAIFTGEVSEREVPGLLASMDVGVAPYPPREDFYHSPLKVVEYMAAGLPVVASGIGQIRELIEDGRSGLLCPPGDLITLTMSLSRLRAEPRLRTHLGAAARGRVLRDRTWDAVAARILTIAGLPPPSITPLAAEGG